MPQASSPLLCRAHGVRLLSGAGGAPAPRRGAPPSRHRCLRMSRHLSWGAELAVAGATRPAQRARSAPGPQSALRAVRHGHLLASTGKFTGKLQGRACRGALRGGCSLACRRVHHHPGPSTASLVVVCALPSCLGLRGRAARPSGGGHHGGSAAVRLVAAGAGHSFVPWVETSLPWGWHGLLLVGYAGRRRPGFDCRHWGMGWQRPLLSEPSPVGSPAAAAAAHQESNPPASCGCVFVALLLHFSPRARPPQGC
jgi:hypothetical protein